MPVRPRGHCTSTRSWACGLALSARPPSVQVIVERPAPMLEGTYTRTSKLIEPPAGMDDTGAAAQFSPYEDVRSAMTTSYEGHGASGMSDAVGLRSTTM